MVSFESYLLQNIEVRNHTLNGTGCSSILSNHLSKGGIKMVFKEYYSSESVVTEIAAHHPESILPDMLICWIIGQNDISALEPRLARLVTRAAKHCGSGDKNQPRRRKTMFRAPFF